MEIIHEDKQQVDKYFPCGVSPAGSPEGLAGSLQYFKVYIPYLKGDEKQSQFSNLDFSGGLPLLHQTCCMAVLEVNMKSNNSQYLPNLNSIPDSGLTS